VTDVEVVSEELLYSAHDNLARVEKVTYSDGSFEFSVWLHVGAWPVETTNALGMVPMFSESAAYVLGEIIYDGDLVGMIYRKES
jgi:hypothetical protein